MDERKIIDRRLLADLAKEVGLNASHLEALGESRQWEIAVDGDMLERLVDIQHRFERLAAMGDDEYRGFYIEVPRPTPEEWEDVEELIAFGEYDSREAFLADWLAFNPMEASWFHVASSRYGDSRSIRVTDRKRTCFIITNRPKCTDAEPDGTWYRESLTHLFDYLERMIDVQDGLHKGSLTASCRISKSMWKIGKWLSRHWRTRCTGVLSLFGEP